MVKDVNFVRFIDNVRNRHDEGSETMTGDMLMQKAMSKYKILKDQGKWNAPSNETERLLVLENKITQLKTTISSWKDNKQKAKKRTEVTTSKSKWPPRPEWLKKHTKPTDVNKVRECMG